MNKEKQAAARQKGAIMMNPIIRRISRIEEKAPDNCASYGGIAARTFFFMLVTAAGVAGYFILHQILAASGSAEIVAGVGQTLGFLSESPVLSIVIGVIYVVVACAFLLVDFDTIQRTVENQMPKKYEWAAAFGLAYTVIFLFLKVFSLLSDLMDKTPGN